MKALEKKTKGGWKVKGGKLGAVKIGTKGKTFVGKGFKGMKFVKTPPVRPTRRVRKKARTLKQLERMVK